MNPSNSFYLLFYNFLMKVLQVWLLLNVFGLIWICTAVYLLHDFHLLIIRIPCAGATLQLFVSLYSEELSYRPFTSTCLFSHMSCSPPLPPSLSFSSYSVEMYRQHITHLLLMTKLTVILIPHFPEWIGKYIVGLWSIYLSAYALVYS